MRYAFGLGSIYALLRFALLERFDYALLRFALLERFYYALPRFALLERFGLGLGLPLSGSSWSGRCS